MSLIFIGAILLSVIVNISTISLYHNNKSIKCFEKNFSKYENITLSYVISGENERNYHVFLKNPSGENIYDVNKREQGKFTKESNESGTYHACFEPFEIAENSVSFEFHGTMEKGHLISIAKGESLDQMQKDVISIQSLFEQIEINIKYLTERYESHSNSKS